MMMKRKLFELRYRRSFWLIISGPLVAGFHMVSNTIPDSVDHASHVTLHRVAMVWCFSDTCLMLAKMLIGCLARISWNCLSSKSDPLSTLPSPTNTNLL